MLDRRFGCIGVWKGVYLRSLFRIEVPSDDPWHRRRHLLPVDDDLSVEGGNAFQTSHKRALIDTAFREAVCYNPGSGTDNAGGVLKVSQSRNQWVRS